MTALSRFSPTPVCLLIVVGGTTQGLRPERPVLSVVGEDLDDLCPLAAERRRVVGLIRAPAQEGPLHALDGVGAGEPALRGRGHRVIYVA